MSYSTAALAFYGVVFTPQYLPRTFDGRTLTSEDLEDPCEGLNFYIVGNAMTGDTHQALLIPESFLRMDGERGEGVDTPSTRLEVLPGWNRRLEDGLAGLGVINAPPPGWYFAWEKG